MDSSFNFQIANYLKSAIEISPASLEDIEKYLEKDKSNKKFYIILTALIIALVIIITGVIIIVTRNNQEEEMQYEIHQGQHLS